MFRAGRPRTKLIRKKKKKKKTRDRQTDRQTDRKRVRQTDRQRQTDIETERERGDRQTDRVKEKVLDKRRIFSAFHRLLGLNIYRNHIRFITDRNSLHHVYNNGFDGWDKTLALG